MDTKNKDNKNKNIDDKSTDIQSNDNFISNLIKRNSIGKETRRIFIKYLVTSIVFVIALSILIGIIINPGTAEYNMQKYFFLYSIPIILIFSIILNLNKNTKATRLFLKLLGAICFFIFGIYLYSTSTNTFNIDYISNYIIVILIVVVGLGILYRALISYMEKLKGWGGFIAQLIFYIPCVFYDVWEYFINEINLTPYSVYLFLLFEILLIILYFYLPDISDKVTGKDNGIELLNDVEFLDNGKMIIANSDDLKIPQEDQSKYKSNLQGEYLTNYCLSMWIYINPHPPNHIAYSKETEIFSYGFTDFKGIEHVKPMIRYYGGGDGSDQLIERNKLVFYFSRYPPVNQYDSDEHTFYDVTIEMQKWNQIVLNYNRNIVDIFINGNLERTFQMKDLPMYNDLDNIVIGDDNGIDGGICNVTYYRHPLSPEQIALSYNTMVNSDLPVPRKKSKTDS
jgi:hypothetical protein